MQANQNDESVDALVLALSLKSPDVEQRLSTARELAGMGHGAEAALPALIEALGDESPEVVSAVIDVLCRIGPPAVPGLQSGLQEREGQSCIPLVVALGEIGPGAVDAVPALIEMLERDDAVVRREVIRTLGQIGPTAQEAIPVLEAVRSDEFLRLAVDDALAAIRAHPRTKLHRGFRKDLSIIVVALLAAIFVLMLVEVVGRAFTAVHPMVTLASLGWFFIGGCMGALVGAYVHGRTGAMTTGIIFGLGGAIGGALLGNLFAYILQPILRVLGG